jgi:hypothetical protein
VLSVTDGKGERAPPGFPDFELAEGKPRNFRLDQERFLDFVHAKSKSLNRDPTDRSSLKVIDAYTKR